MGRVRTEGVSAAEPAVVVVLVFTVAVVVMTAVFVGAMWEPNPNKLGLALSC